VTGSNPLIAAVKHATDTNPVVMAVSRDPVGSGFIARLARPGGNITGLANDPTPEVLAKNLELLKEAAPQASRVALLWNPEPPGAAIYRKIAERAARTLGVTLHSVEVRGRNELEGAFAAMARARIHAVVVLPDPVFLTARTEVAALAARHGLPAIYGVSEHAETGGFMSYGGNVAHQFRRVAVYIDKILRGARPGELAVEQAATFELVINQKTAHALGIAIPASLRLRADRIIE
jgi:putative ABC transport system substrate-binding protein